MSYNWRREAEKTWNCNENARKGVQWMLTQPNYSKKNEEKGEKQEQDDKNEPGKSGLEL